MPISIADELTKLKQLRDDGTLSIDEFEEAKRQLLSDDDPSDASGAGQRRTGAAVSPGEPDTPIEEIGDLLGRTGENSLGRAANRYVDLQIVAFVIAIIVFLLVFFGFFLPQWNSFGSGFGGFGGYRNAPYVITVEP
jgi:hypothetical protein